MRVLLFGANGQVGSECRRIFLQKGWDVISLLRADVDFSEPIKVYEAVKAYKAEVVVNACAYTAVDKAEDEAELADLINAQSVASIGKACNELNIPTIHISTDYVFDGQAKIPYTEEDLVSPLGVYGKSKLEGEQSLQKQHEKHIILRTSWVFGAEGNNFVKTMLRLAKTKDELGVVGDQFGCPTYAGDIANSIGLIIEKINNTAEFSQWGIYHCSNKGETNWCDFSRAIFAEGVKVRVLSREPKVNCITTEEYPTPTARPAYSVLNCNKLEMLLQQSMPSWKTGLTKVCNELL